MFQELHQNIYAGFILEISEFDTVITKAMDGTKMSSGTGPGQTSTRERDPVHRLKTCKFY